MVLALEGDSTITRARPVPAPVLRAALLVATSLLMSPAHAGCLVVPLPRTSARAVDLPAARRHSVTCRGLRPFTGPGRACRTPPEKSPDRCLSCSLTGRRVPEVPG